VEQVDFFCKPS